jgi:hypothetical protein
LGDDLTVGDQNCRFGTKSFQLIKYFGGLGRQEHWYTVRFSQFCHLE